MFDATKLPTTPSRLSAAAAPGSAAQPTTAGAAATSKPPSYPAKDMVLEDGRYRVVDLEKVAFEKLSQFSEN